MDDLRKHLLQMSRTLIRLDEIYYHAAKKLGVTENMLTLLYALNDGGIHTQKQIVQDWLIPKTTINTLVQQCLAAGYVQLTPQSREKAIQLTASGRDYAERLLKPLYAAEEASFTASSPELLPALERYAEHLQVEFDRQIKQGESYENTT